MIRKLVRLWAPTGFAAAVLLVAAMPRAHSAPVERSLLGIHIFTHVAAVLHKYGNPTYVLTAGQTYSQQSGVTQGAPTANGASPQPASAGIPNLPPLQPQDGPVGAFGGPQLPGSQNAPTAEPSTNGEVTLIYQKANGATYQFLLSPSGSVWQITTFGYNDPQSKTSRGVTFGTSYSKLVARYGYPENQSETNGIRIVDYSKRSHVAFELVSNSVVGIVVAAID